MNDQDINEFCFSESSVIYGGIRSRRSLLLELKNDIDYNLGLYGTFENTGIPESKISDLESIIPLLVVPHLYTTAIDLFARILHKTHKPPRGKNKEWFVESAKKFFGLSDEVAFELWNFRNALIHEYSIAEFTISRSGGDGEIIKYIGSNKVVFIRQMRLSLDHATHALAEHLSSESHELSILTKDYIESRAYTYNMLPDEDLSQLSK
jgi:hypothetical protein